MADKRLTLGSAMELIAVMQEFALRTGLTQEQLKARVDGKQGMDIVDVVLSIAHDVLFEAFKDYDRKAKKPGEFCMEAMDAFGGCIGKTGEELLLMELDEEIFAQFEIIFRAEAKGRVGKLISTMTLPLRHLLSSATEIVLTKINQTMLAFAGGQSSGGMTQLLIDSEPDTEELSDPSTDFPLDESSASSEPSESTLS